MKGRVSAGLLLAFASVVLLASGAAAAPSSVGYDVSYPDCGAPLPASPRFGIVGVNDGVTFSSNPCLADELTWARNAANHAPQFYINTGDPGPQFSAHWPSGQQTPKPCNAGQPNSTNCSYDYGWNFAKDSFNRGSFAAGTANAQAARWWLDVEIENSWQTLEAAYGQTTTSKRNDTAAVSGAVAALKDAGITKLGIYSTSYQWTQITGGPSVVGTRFAHISNWLAGYTSQANAQAGCSNPSFTGGPVVYTQFPSGNFDADFKCPQA
jgi:hypothetical protein